MKRSGIWANLALAAVLLPFCVSCATDRSQRRPYLIQENLDNAKRHLDAGRQEEAAQIYEAVLLADPNNATAKAKLDGISSFSRNVMAPSMLGKNLTRRPVAAGFWKQVLAYPFNRVLDALDIVSFSAGPQGGAYFDFHATHAMQVAAGAGGGMEVGWYQPRNLALGSVNMTGLALGPVGAEGEGYTRIGLRGGDACAYSVVGLSRPTEYAYQKYRDYWGVGVRAVAGIAGAGVEIHPVEIFDFVGGFFFIDFLHDDIGHTKALKITTADAEAMSDLLKTLSRDEMNAHQAMLGLYLKKHK